MQATAQIVPKPKRIAHMIYDHRDGPVVGAVKHLLEARFPDALEVYMFESSNAAGDAYAEKLLESLHAASLSIAFFSANAAKSQWFRFETGAAWALASDDARRLIPILHGGFTAQELPDPVRNLHAIDANQEHFATELIGRIADHLGVLPQRVSDTIPIELLKQRLSAAAVDRSAVKYFLSGPSAFRPWSSGLNPFDQTAGAGYDEAMQRLYRAIEANGDTVYRGKAAVIGGGLYQSREKLKNALRFIMVVPGKVNSSCFIEAGVAASLGIPSLYWVRDEAHLPNYLRHLESGVRIQRYSNLDEIVAAHSNKSNDAFAGL